ncbi:hypothetical protein BDQ17DRAFT_1389832 [Cyathus striatus]|nr:hypothetical protein BDQ17DRAFT_1389832 [Cyathus striatus]
MPPRSVNVLGGGYVQSLQPNSHRTPAQQSQVSSITPQPSPGFMQTRGQSGFGFGGVLGQHQPSAVSLQQQQQQQHQQQLSSQQQQPTNGTSSSLPPHLQTPNLGSQSVSSTSEVSLDPNDFPALGSTPASNSTSNNANGSTTTSYASQAGTAVPIGGGAGAGSGGAGTIGSNGGNQQRDFTPDDFPALGGQSQAQNQNPSQNQTSNQDGHSHPPGLNGFQHSEHSQQQHRPNILGGLQHGTPGMLNLGPTQTRNVHPGFQAQSETEKQQQQQRNNYSLKLNQASHAAWNSTNAQSQQGTSTPNGTHPSQNPMTPHPTAPPGVPPPSNYAQQQSQGQQAAPTPTNAPGLGASSETPPYSPSNGGGSHITHPQTPAQQILMSAADRWGLLSLIALMKNANTEPDQGLSSMGTDLSTIGVDMGYSGNLYSTFITPWADQSAASTVEPDFHLPACYLNHHAPPPGPAKAAAFSDETLFFMFYSSPRDALQEVAAQELFNRNWRYHKDLRLWITKESGTSPSQKVQNGIGEQGQYTFWDPENWGKERKEMTVMYADLEEKNTPAFQHAPGLILSQAAQAQQGQLSGPVQQNQVPSSQRGSFQMGMAGM